MYNKYTNHQPQTRRCLKPATPTSPPPPRRFEQPNVYNKYIYITYIKYTIYTLYVCYMLCNIYYISNASYTHTAYTCTMYIRQMSHPSVL